MGIEVKVVADSISPTGHQMRSVQVKHHRFILSEINTHRMLSKSNRSSRAVPFEKLLEEVHTNPATPVFWGKNQSGMQAREELTHGNLEQAKRAWSDARYAAIEAAKDLAYWGTHKQIVNRLLEPFLWQHGLLSGTNWNNFFALRRHPDAQPEFKALADAIWDAFEASKPTLLQPGEWHLPYIDDGDWHDLSTYTHESLSVLARRVSAARCARISYRPFDSDTRDIEKDLALAAKLLESRHMSPFEHQATPDGCHTQRRVIHLDEGIYGPTEIIWHQPERHANLTGWIQNRMTIPGEHVPG